MTSILYPRLLDVAAAELHKDYIARDLAELRKRYKFSHPSAVFAATGGQRVSISRLEKLRSEVMAVAVYNDFPGGGRRRDHSDFDLAVARLLYDECGLVAAEAAVRSIWAFLALVVLPDISYWRYPHAPRDRILATDITRHVWGRLWWRAHLLTLPGDGDDRFRLLDTFNESELDQILARRRLLGGSSALIHALAQVWPTLDGGPVSNRELLRDLLKRLLRASAVIEYDSLSELDLLDQIREEALLSLHALRKTK